MIYVLDAPQSQDLSPTDSLIFYHFGFSIRDKKYANREKTGAAFEEFIASEDNDFTKDEIYSLPGQWKTLLRLMGL